MGRQDHPLIRHHGLAPRNLFGRLEVRSQHVVLREGKGARGASVVEAILQKQLHQHNLVLALKAVKHERGFFIGLAAAEQIVEVPEHVRRALALLERVQGLSNLPLAHEPLKRRVRRASVLASDVFDKRGRLVIDRMVMDVVEQPRPHAALLKAARHVTGAVLEEVVDDPRNQLALFVGEVELLDVGALVMRELDELHQAHYV